MGRSGKGMTTSLNLTTKTPNNKQKERTAITEITNQDSRNLLKELEIKDRLVAAK